MESDRFFNSPLPVHLKNVVKWDLINWTLADWKILDTTEREYSVTKGRRQCSLEPPWDSHFQHISMTINDVLDLISTVGPDEWVYFDYNHIGPSFFDKTHLKGISWDFLGLPFSSEESTLWIGSKGAHTPCHMDTYSCNVVAQIHGRKRWLLFSPDEGDSLLPTRVPYEESTIFSSINFACGCNPSLSSLTPYSVELEPGDVLFIPPRWWHYVENITSAISINTWVPLESDDDGRLGESLVKTFMSLVLDCCSREDTVYIRNPNSKKECLSIPELLREASLCVYCISNPLPLAHDIEHTNISGKLSQIRKISSEEFASEWKSKCSCPKKVESNKQCEIPESMDEPAEQPVHKQEKQITLEQIVNAFCHPDVIELVKEKLLKSVT